MAVVALTDIHGRFDCLEAMMDLLHRKLPGSDHKIVLCGDYVDRGPQSKEVVYAVEQGKAYFGWETLPLTGNHEELFIDAVDHQNLGVFINNGGDKTLKSFLDLENYSDIFEEGRVPNLRSFPILARASDFFKTLPYLHVEGKFVFVHAGFCPGHPIEDQIKHPEEWTEYLTWVRDPFLRDKTDHGYHVVHGHTPHDYDDYRAAAPHRTNLDSAAFYYGKLTGAIIHDINDRKSIEVVSVDLGRKQ